MSSSESLCPVTATAVHALPACRQRLELYPVDFIRAPGSPDAPAKRQTAVTPQSCKGATPASGKACVSCCDIRGLMPGALALAGHFDQVPRLTAGDLAARHDYLVSDTRATGSATLGGPIVPGRTRSCRTIVWLLQEPRKIRSVNSDGEDGNGHESSVHWHGSLDPGLPSYPTQKNTDLDRQHPRPPM